MQFGRFPCVLSLLVLSFGLLCSEVMAGAQQSPPPSAPAETMVPALPAAQPLSEAAVGTVPKDTQPAKSPNGDASTGSVTLATEDSSRLRLGAGDLLEVGVYNVPELSTKARVGNSGDIYLPLIIFR